MKPLPLVTVLFLSTLLIGCAGEEYTYVDASDLKPGPGLLSGEDGVFTIYGKSAAEREREEEENREQKVPVNDKSDTK